MALTNEDKTEIRNLIHQEIGKAVDAAFDGVIARPIDILDVTSAEKRDEREKQNALLRQIKKTVKDSLHPLMYPNSQLPPAEF